LGQQRTADYQFSVFWELGKLSFDRQALANRKTSNINIRHSIAGPSIIPGMTAAVYVSAPGMSTD
jgi:hypothetical protein